MVNRKGPDVSFGRSMLMTCAAALATVAFAGAVPSSAEPVVIENARLRLVLSPDGCATSLVAKATGEECLLSGVCVPFATLLQDRPYDNEFKLMLPAGPVRHPSNRLVRRGDELLVEFEDEFNVLHVTLDVTDDYVALTPTKLAYRFEDFGDKRATEVDGLVFARLPLKKRAHFGRLLNVAWDDRAAVALLATAPETQSSCDVRADGGADVWVGTSVRERLLGTGAALVVGDGREGFLDGVDAVERDFRLPRGVALRRDPLHAASYAFFGSELTPATVDACIDLTRRAGFGMMVVSYTAFAATCGHYAWRKAYPNGLADLKAVTDRIRAAGLVPGVHVHYNKVSTNDAYVTRFADPRMATVCEVTLAKDVGAADTELELQGLPRGLRTENGRRIVRFGEEYVAYASFTTERPYRLTGCVRGLHGSKATAHRRGEYGRHVDVDDWPYFIRIDPRTEIGDEIAGRLADIVDAAGFRFVYYDGAEDVPSPFWCNVPRAQVRVDSRFAERPFGNEGAQKSHFGWHLLSRGNAFDKFLPERTREAMRKYVLRTARQDADDFSYVNFGWLGFWLPDEAIRRPSDSFLTHNAAVEVTVGTQPDMYEYVASKAAAWDCPLSVQISPEKLRHHPHAADILGVLRRWEEAKLQGRLSAAQRDMLKDPVREWFLYPTADGSVEPVECRKVTEDAERPVRAFAYVRNGRSGLVCWNVGRSEVTTFEISGSTSFVDGGRRFIESTLPCDELVAAFRRACR